MSVEQVIALVSALSLAILTPGPSIIATVQTAFAHGRERALPYALGLAVGASLWCIFALLGLAVLFKLHPSLYAGFKIFGGFYLLWFAWALWKALISSPEDVLTKYGRSRDAVLSDEAALVTGCDRRSLRCFPLREIGRPLYVRLSTDLSFAESAVSPSVCPSSSLMPC